MRISARPIGEPFCRFLPLSLHLRLSKYTRLGIIIVEGETGNPAEDVGTRERAMRQFMRDRWAFLLVALLGAAWVAVAILEV